MKHSVPTKTLPIPLPWDLGQPVKWLWLMNKETAEQQIQFLTFLSHIFDFLKIWSRLLYSAGAKKSSVWRCWIICSTFWEFGLDFWDSFNKSFFSFFELLFAVLGCFHYCFWIPQWRLFVRRWKHLTYLHSLYCVSGTYYTFFAKQPQWLFVVCRCFILIVGNQCLHHRQIHENWNLMHPPIQRKAASAKWSEVCTKQQRGWRDSRRDYNLKLIN